MPRKNKIIIRTGTGAPTASDFVTGEPAFDSSAGTLYVKNAAGTMAAVGVADPYDLGTYPLITISAQPASASASQGQSATFSVTATATSPSATISYQWQVSTNSGSTWTNISGATSASYTLSNAQVGDSNKQFRCVLTANLSAVTTSAAVLTYTSFSPTAVLLTSGTTYTVPANATTMKAWAVGAGGATTGGAAGGCAYKTWTVSGGATVTYAVGAANAGASGSPSTVTFGGVTITGGGGGNGNTPGTYSGGDGGANGGRSSGYNSGGAVGGNGSVSSCARVTMTDVSGLKAAVALAGGKTVEDCGSPAAFGSGGGDKYNLTKGPGYGGGVGQNTSLRVSGAVVLYFT